VLGNSAGMGPDWIELRNTTSQAVNIGGWFLSDDDDTLTKYRIAEGTVLPPGRVPGVRRGVALRQR
jgi:hypothetical protein